MVHVGHTIAGSTSLRAISSEQNAVFPCGNSNSNVHALTKNREATELTADFSARI